MANKWKRKLGMGMSVIMTVSQLSGMVSFAAPEEEGWEDASETEETFSIGEFGDILEEKFQSEKSEFAENDGDIELQYQLLDEDTYMSGNEIESISIDQDIIFAEVSKNVTVNLNIAPENASFDDVDISVRKYDGTADFAQITLNEDKKSLTIKGVTKGIGYFSVKIGDCYSNSVELYISEDGIYESGISGDLNWSLSDDNDDIVLTISGTGEMEDYEYTYYDGGGHGCDDAPWTKYIYNKVVIEEGVQNIGNCAFTTIKNGTRENTYLESVEIPSSVTKIGYHSFLECTNLKSITLPDSLTVIENGAFAGCSINSITLPEGLTKLGDPYGYNSYTGVFDSCENLESITIPAGVTAIGRSAFSSCTALKDVNIQGNVTDIGFAAFQGCTGLCSIDLPDSLENIGDSAFYECTGLTGISIPDSVKNVGSYAFWNCEKLENLEGGKNITTIGYNAFRGSGIQGEINMPNVTDIGSDAFRECGVTSINFPKAEIIGQSAFEGCNISGAVKLPSIIRIDQNAFLGNSGITSLTLSANLTSIGTTAFKGCRNLTDVYFGGTREDWIDVTKIGNDWIDNATIHYESTGPSEQDIADKEAAVAAEGKIISIGTVEYTETSKGKIDDARTAYNALTDTQKGMVSNYSILTAAEAEYAKLDAANTDRNAASTVEDKIKAIGTVAYSVDCKTKIDTARTAYDALTETQKLLVSNTDTLLAAEREYQALKSAADQEASDKEAAEAVEDKITAIGTVSYTTESKTKIDAARAAYDQLTAAQKMYVENANALVMAENEYASLKVQAEQAAADKDAAGEVEDKITAIGTVSYTDTCKVRIDSARTAYNDLTYTQKRLVSNAEALDAAEAEYARLQQASEREAADLTAAGAVVDKIKDIGTVTYSNTSKVKIDAARSAYEKLTDSQKALVTNYTDLTGAEEAYEAFAEAEAQNIADAAAADAVIAKIKTIGTVACTDECKAKIDAAREEYDKLTDAQKKLVNNYTVLTAAENDYKTLKEAAARQEADAMAAKEVSDKIDEIGEVTYSNASKMKIDAARSAYELLTADQKPLVENLEVLTTAENAYATLVEAEKTNLADAEAADAVIEKIRSIGTVEKTDDCKAGITEAREAYEKLTDDQKILVTNYAVLTVAESSYEAMNTPIPIPVTDVKLDRGEVTLKQGSNSVLEVMVSPEDAPDKILTWSSSNTSVVTVTATEDGSMAIVQGISAGTATITVIASNGVKAECAVTVAASVDPVIENGFKQEEDGSFYYYKDGEVAADMIGYVEWEGSKFYLTNGKVDTSVNGVMIDGSASPLVWYFCANGQVQIQHKGLAEYDGAWFYVEKGKVASDMNAFVEYNGGLFAVAAGRIVSEYNGLMQDPQNPETGEWYFFANGQAQTQYTGLAMYDNVWFYVVNGKLAQDYTGNVDYDGSTFYVENGMVK